MQLENANSEPLTPEAAPARAAAFLATVPPYPGTFAGRGVVICAGGVRYLTCAWVLIKMLRNLGCTLPIEVWHLGDEERDPNWFALAEPLGVRRVDGHDVNRRLAVPHPRLGGWQAKAFAVLHSGFEEVLLLDADNVPVVDPTFLFDSPEYRATGAIFWPDCFRSHREAEVLQLFGVSYRDEWQQESGQVLVNKRVAWPAACLCDWYNRHSDLFYRFIYGDKDTFRLAWHRAGIPYSMPPRLESRGLSIRQGDFAGNLVFQHRHGNKWTLHGDHLRSPEFIHQSACFALLQELAECWNPMSHRLRRLSDADRAESLRWGDQDFHYSIVGRRRWPVRLRRNGVIAGAGPLERYWWCEGGRMFLSRLDRNPALVLTKRSATSWLGRSSLYGGVEVLLAKTRYTRAERPRQPHRRAAANAGR